MSWYSILISHNQERTTGQSVTALADDLSKLQRESGDLNAFHWYKLLMSGEDQIYYLSPEAGKALIAYQHNWSKQKCYPIHPCEKPNMGAVKKLPL